MLVTKFLRRYSCLLLLICTCFKSFAWQNDAGLLSRWEKAKAATTYRTDTSNVKLLNDLSALYLNKNTDSALFFAKQAQQLAHEQHNAVGEAVAQLNVSRVALVKDNRKLRSEIQTKEHSIAFAKRLLFFRNMIAVVVIILIIFIIRSNRQKTRLNAVLQKQNEEILQQKAEILHQKETLHQLNRTKDQLFSVISHDLRSPFAAILQTMDNMGPDELSPAEQKEVLNGFYQQLSLVTIMVNNLLAWAVSQQSGNKTDLMTLDVSKVIDEIVTLSNFLAKNKRITLCHNYDAEKLVQADLNHVRIVFNNLIGNAIKFTPHGGTINVSYTTDEDYQIIHVTDNGIGILPQKMEKLFKVTGKDISGFGTNNEAGAGIGLGLIKQFVDANNGKLEVKSRPGEGSEFVVYLEKAG
ncbi:MAG TPA: HAMP domain-containing sensor histidine kinase [Mucilaginibacter sp.]